MGMPPDLPAAGLRQGPLARKVGQGLSVGDCTVGGTVHPGVERGREGMVQVPTHQGDTDKGVLETRNRGVKRLSMKGRGG